MKLTEAQQRRIGLCVEKLKGAGTDMDESMMFGLCTIQEKAGKLDNTGHVIGSKTMAEELDLSFAVQSSDFVELPGEVEVFKSGKWIDGKGTAFDASPEFVEKIFKDTREMGFVQPIKLHHTDQTAFLESMKAQSGISLPVGGLPALGYNPITRISKNQDGSVSVFGRLTNIPKHIAEIMKNLYRNRSAEISSVQDGKGGRKEVFSGTALLGMSRPIIHQLAASFGQMFKGENPSMVYSDSEEIETQSFTFSDAASQEAGADNTGAAEAETQNNQLNSGKERSIVEPFKTFASEAEYTAFIASQKEGLVPKAELDRLQAERDAEKQRVYFAEIDSKVASLITPNERKQSLPPFVKDQLAPILKTIPQTVQFGEGNAAVSAVDAIVKLFGDVAKTGMVDFAEHIKQTGNENKTTEAAWEAEAKKEFAEIDPADRVSSEASYVKAFIQTKRDEIARKGA